MKKIGIYAGSFDPIHDGHMAFARRALQSKGLEKVFFLVEPRPRRKQGVKALEHRAAMVQLAIKDDKKLGSIVLHQQRFTVIDTLPVLAERFKGAKLFMLMGDDLLSRLAEWPHVEELVEEVEFIIAMRKFSREEVERRLHIIQRTRGLAMRYTLVDPHMSGVSSAAIRQAIKKGKQPAGVLLSVLAYIKSAGLYSVVRS